MEYSDRDLLVATQIAYYDIKQADTNKTLRQICKDDPDIYNHLLENQEEAESNLEKIRAQRAIDLYHEIVSSDSKYGDWIIKNVKNNNEETGFYGCLIETSDKSAIVGFRGSESSSDTQIKKDWVEADLGLLNHEATNQQEVATEYMKYINEEYDYENYATSGHSLGGNLSAHAGLTAPEEMRNKITQCYSFDGPGFSNEYIAEHQDEIEAFGTKITHYQWSLVGELLYHLPGEKFKTIKTKDEVYGKKDMQSLTQKHDTCFVEFDENGNVISGEMDVLAATVGRLSKTIENNDTGNALIAVVSWALSLSGTQIKVVGISTVISTLLAGYVVCPKTTTVALITTLAIIVCAVADPDFCAEKLIPFVAGIAEGAIEISACIKKVIRNVIDGMKENVKKLVDVIMREIDQLLNNVAQWFYRRSAGYSYAAANPYIVVDTTTMRTYASSLSALSRRAKNLDSSMNSLYRTLGIDWSSIATLAALLKAEVVLDFAGRLDKCADYLNQTAEDFENVERTLITEG